MRPAHRVRQFVAHLRARVGDDETALAHRHLPAGARPLFDAMPVADRRHAIDVARRLLDAGVRDADALAAALLHDAAKGHRMRLWHRVGGVLLEAFAPGLLRRVARDDPRSWRHGFHLYLHHAELSARAALDVGCSPRAAALIRGQAPSAADAGVLEALRAADEAG